MARRLDGNKMVTPTRADAAVARELGEKLAAHLGNARGVRLEMKTGDKSDALVLPPSALRLFSSVSR